MRPYIDILNEAMGVSPDDEHYWLIEAYETELDEGKWSNLVTAGGVAAGLAMGAMGSQAKAATPLPQEVAACSSQDLSWCDSEQKRPLAADQDATMMKVAQQANRFLRYDPNDQSTTKNDKWQSFHADAESEKKFRGDCDDLTLTVIEMAVKAGVSETRLYRALVAVDRSDSPKRKEIVMGHMVAIYEDTNGKFWVIGDTNNLQEPMAALEHFSDRGGGEIRYVSNVAMGKNWQHANMLGKLQRVADLRAQEQKPMQVAQVGTTH